MNKYSKRALKTTATVGMSLAMVLSGMAAPLTNVKAADASCTIANKNEAQLIIDSIKADIKAAGYTLNTIPVNATKNKGTTVDIAWVNTIAVSNTNEIAAGDTIADVLNAKNTDDTFTLSELISPLAVEGCSKDYKEDATKLDRFEAKVTNYVDAMTDLATELANLGVLADGVITTSEWDASIEDLYNDVITHEGYKDNVATTVSVTDKVTNRENITSLKEMVEDYTNTYINKFVKAYVEELEKVEIEGKSVKSLVKDNTTKYSRDDLKELEDTIKDIKEDKLSDLTDTGVTYAQVGEEDEVADYIDGLEAIVDEIKEVNDLLKSNTASQKALKAVKSKVTTLVSEIKVVATTSQEIEDREIAITRAMNEFRAEDLENLTTYVEDFFNEFYTVSVKQRSNGNYSVDVDGTSYARYLNSTDATAFELTSGVGYLMSTLVEKDADETYYESLVGNVNDAEKLMKAVAAVEDIRLGTTFTSAQATTIVSAKKAYTELTADGNPYGLTSKELRAVKANGDLIDALYAKLILTGTITETGWVNKGNGNWDYINADGSTSTKWVAAGTDWYYVKAGNMLRNSWIANDATGSKWYYVDDAGKMVFNTTVNGYTFDANGVWVK